MNLNKVTVLVGVWVLLAFTTVSSSYAHDDKKHTKLEDAMSASNKAFKLVRRQAADESQNKKSAKLVAKMIANFEKGVNYKPKWTAEKPKSEQAAYVDAYRKEMQASLKLLKELQAAFSKNDNAKAKTLIKEIRAHQKENHKLYKKPKPKKK